MSSARMSTLASLRETIGHIEGEFDGLARTSLGHCGADSLLQGGLVRGALHEVFASEQHNVTGAGFIAGLAQRLCTQRHLLWVRQNFVDVESGTLSATGLTELGFDPRRLIRVHAHNVEIALRTAADALACDALGAVVLDIWGETKALDIVASRKLTLAARASHVTCLVLRTAASLSITTAETRWVVRTARSMSTTDMWGNPTFDAELVRNRHGQTGRWIMEWKRDEAIFRDIAAHPQPVAAAPAYRPAETALVRQRRTG
ncbi:MAG: DNA repair protein [Afipia sp.]|nr:DNA repair protein [Afipia sp.]